MREKKTIEREPALKNQQTKKTNKNKNMAKIKIAVQHVQTIAQEKKHKAKQSKAKQMYTYNIIQKYEKKKQTNKQALTITKY